MNYFKYGLLVITIVAGWGLQGCSDDSTGPEDNGKDIEASIAEAGTVSEIQVTDEETIKEEFTLEAKVGSSPLDKEVEVTFKANASAVDDYNEENSENYTVLPSDNYSLESKSTISAGETKSEPVTLTVTNDPELGHGEYLLAITLSVDDIEISIDEGSATRYFLVTNSGDVIPFGDTKVIITGFLPDPPGRDLPAPGATRGGFELPDDTGYEYIQLMALEDIDFSEDNYSVVIAKNRTVREDGWAAGGFYTYKFNLTEGTADKGTFFYVGGAGKRINGFDKDNEKLSTDISEANWIRAIQMNEGVDPDGNDAVVTGDGFGLETTSMLQNMNKAGSADGMAVFEGTNVDAESIPHDAIFYNPPINGAYDPPNGYQIPDNEFYSREDGELYGEGANDYTVLKPDAESLLNLFATMGGELTENGWIKTREPSWKELSIDSQLSEIEEGDGVTKFIND